MIERAWRVFGGLVVGVAVLLALRPWVGRCLAPPGRPPPVLEPSGGEAIKILSFNVLCSVCVKEGYDGWSARVPQLRALLEAYDPDVAAVLELVGEGDTAFLLGPDTPWAVVRASSRYADTTILYKKSSYTLIDEGVVWLSPTPGAPFGWPWEPLSMPRYLAWAELSGPGGHFVFAAAHVDASRANQVGSARLIGGLHATVLAGDLNLRADDPLYATLAAGRKDAATLAPRVERAGAYEGVPHTRSAIDPDRAIDHILVPADAMVARFVHDAPVYGAPPRRPSDHPVVYAEVRLAP